jgi:very-short-patch-repair endonuclease
MAACLWGGEGAAASHSSAAKLWRLPGMPLSIHVITTKSPTRLPAWVHVHRVACAPPGVELVSGITVVPPWRALLDLGACAAGLVERALDEALRLRLVSLPRMRWALDTYGGPGRRGAGVLGPLVAARDAPGTRYVPPESELEAHLYRLVEASDLPSAERQYPFWDGRSKRRLDLAFVQERVAVEVDGYWCHSGREAWQNDRARDNAMIKLGWRTLRFTWEDLQSRPESVLADIRRTLVQKPR